MASVPPLFSALFQEHIANNRSDEDKLLAALRRITPDLDTLKSLHAKKVWQDDAVKFLAKSSESTIKQIKQSLILIWSQITADQQQRLMEVTAIEQLEKELPGFKRGQLKSLKNLMKKSGLEDIAEYIIPVISGGDAQRQASTFIRKAIEYQSPVDQIKAVLEQHLQSKPDNYRLKRSDFVSMENILEKHVNEKGALPSKSAQSAISDTSALGDRTLRRTTRSSSGSQPQPHQTRTYRARKRKQQLSDTIELQTDQSRDSEEDESANDLFDPLPESVTLSLGHSAQGEPDTKDTEPTASPALEAEAEAEVRDSGASQTRATILDPRTGLFEAATTLSKLSRKRKASFSPTSDPLPAETPPEKRQRPDGAPVTPPATEDESALDLNSIENLTEECSTIHVADDTSSNSANVTSSDRVLVPDNSSPPSMIKGAREWKQQLKFSAGEWLNDDSIIRSLRLLCDPLYTYVLDLSRLEMHLWSDIKRVVIPAYVPAHWLLVIFDVGDGIARTYNSRSSMPLKDDVKVRIESRLGDGLKQLRKGVQVQWARPEARQSLAVVFCADSF